MLPGKQRVREFREKIVSGTRESVLRRIRTQCRGPRIRGAIRTKDARTCRFRRRADFRVGRILSPFVGRREREREEKRGRRDGINGIRRNAR